MKRLKEILIFLIFTGCNYCEYVPMRDNDGGYMLDPNGNIICECDCTYNNWEPCNDTDTPRHNDCQP